MKKLLLLALTVTAAASLTACGSSGHKEIDNFMETLNPTTDGEVANYTVAYYVSNTRIFDVQGSTMAFTGYQTGNSGTVSERDEFYDYVVGEDGFFTTGTSYVYSTTTDGVKMYNKYDVNMENTNDYSIEAAQNPFLQVAEYLELDDEITSKNFKFDKDSSTFYFVNPTLDKAVQDVTTVTTSSMTIVFNYSETDSKVLESVVVKGYSFGTWTYTNFGDVDFTLPTDAQIRN